MLLAATVTAKTITLISNECLKQDKRNSKNISNKYIKLVTEFNQKLVTLIVTSNLVDEYLN